MIEDTLLPFKLPSVQRKKVTAALEVGAHQFRRRCAAARLLGAIESEIGIAARVAPLKVRRFVITLSVEKRERLETKLQTGKHSARKLLCARILLKADASGAEEARTDSQIAAGLRTSLMTVARVRQRLVEEGIGRVLTPKRSGCLMANPPRQ